MSCVVVFRDIALLNLLLVLSTCRSFGAQASINFHIHIFWSMAMWPKIVWHNEKHFYVFPSCLYGNQSMNHDLRKCLICAFQHFFNDVMSWGYRRTAHSYSGFFVSLFVRIICVGTVAQWYTRTALHLQVKYQWAFFCLFTKYVNIQIQIWYWNHLEC